MNEHTPKKRQLDNDGREDDGRDNRRPSIEPDDRDEYEDWRRDRGTRGRKRRDKAGGRHHQRRERDEF